MGGLQGDSGFTPAPTHTIFNKNVNKDYLMINRINSILDLTLKVLSLSFTFFIFIGVAVIWSYLIKSGIGNEISSVLASPQVLLTIAVYSILISVGVIFIFILVPIIINFCERTAEIQWAKNPQPNYFILHFLLVFIPLTLYMLFAWSNVRGGYIILPYLLVCLLMTCIFYKAYGGPEITNWKNKIKNFFIVYYALALAYGLLVFSLIFFLQVTIYLGQSDLLQWSILLVIFIIYSLTVAIATSSPNFMSYTPIFFVSLLLLGLLFMDSVSTNVVSKLGVGSYISSYAIDANNIVLIGSDTAFEIEETESRDVLVLKNVWVVAALPNKLILRANKEEISTYSIPIIAVLGEKRVTKK